VFRYAYVVSLCVAALAVACDRDNRDEDDALFLDGGKPGGDGGTPRGGSGGRAASSGRGGPGGNDSAGSGGVSGTSGTAGSAGTTFTAGTGAPMPGIDCDDDNGGCGDPEFIQCVATSQGGYCADRDECLVNNGGCDRLTYCTNVRGGPPTCGTCPYGYEGDAEKGCTDINECEAETANCGDPDHTRCVNYMGGYTCEDMQECMTDNGGCGAAAEAFCIEQPSAAPICRPNECFVDNGGCGSTDMARCVDRPDITAFCLGKVVAINASEATCVLRADQALDCLSPEIEGGLYRFPNRYTKMATSQSLICGIEPGGSVHCEMAPSELQSEPTGTNFTAITAGYYHACALRSDGTAACWGVDQGGSVTRPHFEMNLRFIAASGYSTCVVRTAGTIACFGSDETGALSDANEDGGTDFTAIYMSEWNICGLHADGSAECWGNNEFGQVSGVAQNGSGPYQSLSIGEATICGLRTDGTVRCWGADQFGQATGPNGAGNGIAQVSAGPGRTCLVWTDGTFRCYGSDDEGPNSDPWAHAAP
jgi:hypothetical protein